MTGTEADSILTTTQTTFEIIEILDRLETATVSQIADEFGKPPSTVHGHLVTLLENGYVVKNGDLYELSLKFFSLGNNVRTRKRAHVIADEYTRKVAEETGCRSIFGVEEHGQGVYISRNSGNHSNWKHEKVGNRFHLHATAAGKAILAHLPGNIVEEILDGHELPRCTENTITDRNELLEELERVRDRGVGFNREESLAGVRAVAAPVFDRNDNVIGALSANGPAHQLVDEKFMEALPTTIIGIANEFELDLSLTN